MSPPLSEDNNRKALNHYLIKVLSLLASVDYQAPLIESISAVERTLITTLARKGRAFLEGLIIRAKSSEKSPDVTSSLNMPHSLTPETNNYNPLRYSR